MELCIWNCKYISEAFASWSLSSYHDIMIELIWTHCPGCPGCAPRPRDGDTSSPLMNVNWSQTDIVLFWRGVPHSQLKRYPLRFNSDYEWTLLSSSEEINYVFKEGFKIWLNLFSFKHLKCILFAILQGIIAAMLAFRTLFASYHRIQIKEVLSVFG